MFYDERGADVVGRVSTLIYCPLGVKYFEFFEHKRRATARPSTMNCV